jgi:K(+)-stimulated pyrophosphate-energized sodium pump
VDGASAATLRLQYQEQLGRIASILQAYPAVEVKLGGYTDNTGTPEGSLKLSQARGLGEGRPGPARGPA